MEATQMTPVFSTIFYANCRSHSFLKLKIRKIHVIPPQNLFSFPFGPFWSVKYLDFRPIATDSDSSSYFSRKQTRWLLKSYMSCPPAGAKYPFFGL